MDGYQERKNGRRQARRTAEGQEEGSRAAAYGGKNQSSEIHRKKKYSSQSHTRAAAPDSAGAETRRRRARTGTYAGTNVYRTTQARTSSRRNNELDQLLEIEEESQREYEEYLERKRKREAKRRREELARKQTFQELLTETLGDACDYETVVSIHENLNELIEEKKDLPEPPTLTKPEVKNLLVQSGASEEVMEHFEEQFDSTAGEKTEFLATNLTNTKALEVKTPDVVVKVSPEKAALLETRVIDGRSYLLIQIDDQVEVNGVAIRPVTLPADPEAEDEL